MDTPALRALDGTFEVGSHTLDHAYADSMSGAEWQRQVNAGKLALEDRLGHGVAGFCYLGGKRQADSLAIVGPAGFAYARTGVNLQVDAGEDCFLMPTTLQVYPHRGSVLLRNFVKGRHWRRRLPGLVRALSQADLHRRLMALLEQALASDGVFHAWGHSWEIEALGLWPRLDEFLRSANAVVPVDARVSNHGVILRLAAAGQAGGR
jgi:Polysaccharide deacetylase